MRFNDPGTSQELILSVRRFGGENPPGVDGEVPVVALLADSGGVLSSAELRVSKEGQADFEVACVILPRNQRMQTFAPKRDNLFKVSAGPDRLDHLPPSPAPRQGGAS